MRRPIGELEPKGREWQAIWRGECSGCGGCQWIRLDAAGCGGWQATCGQQAL